MRYGNAALRPNRRESRKRDSAFTFVSECQRQNISRDCSAVDNFDFFHSRGLASHPHRHHCLAALPGDKADLPLLFVRARRISGSRGVVSDPKSLKDPAKSRMYRLYSMQRSGNSYKVRLALALLNAPYRAIEIDILRGESRTPEFLAKNPSGQVPLLEVAEDRFLAESNAILWYVAGGTSLAPDTQIERAEALQWMFFEQHALEPNIGAAYFWLSLVKGGRTLQTHALEDWMERGYAALQVMENHIKTNQYFAAGQLTVADIALYGYTHVADRCDYDLATFPAVRAWLRRVEQTPGFVDMEWRSEIAIEDSPGIAAEA
jgi:glutathione S-transferase